MLGWAGITQEKYITHKPVWGAQHQNQVHVLFIKIGPKKYRLRAACMAQSWPMALKTMSPEPHSLCLVRHARSTLLAFCPVFAAATPTIRFSA